MTFRKLIAGYLSPSLRTRAIRLEQIGRDRLTPAFKLFGVNRHLLKKALRCPQDVQIEITSTCDADCIMCPRRSMSRRQGPMEFSLFRKIVDEAVEMGVPMLSLNGYGEISTLKNCREYLAYIRSRSRDIAISINTNGMRMAEELAQSYIDFRVNVVNITIDGATAETFESIRKHLKLEQVEHNVRRLIELRKKMNKRLPLISVGMIVMEQNRLEVEAFRKKWERGADKVMFSGLNNRAGSVEWVPVERAANPGMAPCFFLWSQLPIWNDGSVALCCEDWNADGSVDNAAAASLSEIWSSHERQRLRQIHSARRGLEVPACKFCRKPYPGPQWFQGMFAAH